MRRPSARLPLVPALVISLVSVVACGSPPADQAPRKEEGPDPEREPQVEKAKANDEKVAALQAKIDQFVPVKLEADLSGLDESERKALDALIEAAKLLDPIFDRQVFAGYPELEAQLRRDDSELGKAKFAYFQIMRGPWDRQAHHEPFATDKPHPPGAGFYPEDLDEAGFRAYVDAHPDQRAALENLVAVVQRNGDELVAVPYSTAYEKWLEPAARKLEEAADLTANESLSTFLRSRAAAFRSDDYYQSDKDWMDLDSRVEVTIGPYETYEDKLMGLKASFEAFVTVSDPKASADLAKFKALLPEMEKNLPVDDSVKTKRGAESPIRVVDLVYTSGDARKSVQTIAFNLPNDERVRKEKGAKKVMLRNAIDKKFEAIMTPIANEVLDPSQHEHLSAEAFFLEVLFHELSHSLGPAHVGNDESKGEVKVALGASYAALEEGKADVMGAYNILFMIERGEFPKELRERLLVTYFAGLFRSVRFGVAEAHGKGAAMQINRFVESGAATFDPSSRTFKVDLDKLEAEIEKLVHDVCMWQHEGDKAAVDAMFEKIGVVSPSMQAALDKLEAIPVDIRPSYPAAGE